MRLPALCLVLLLTGGTTVFADVYQFSFTGSDAQLNGLGIPNSYSETFTIDSSALIPPTASDGYFCGMAASNCFVSLSHGTFYTVYRNGSISESLDIGLSPFATFAYSTNATQSSALTLFSGLSAAPTMVTGTFYGYYDSGVSYNPEGPVTITDLSTSPVPEPSTLAMLGSGALGVGAIVRRRLTA